MTTCPLCWGPDEDDPGAWWSRGFLCPVCGFYRNIQPGSDQGSLSPTPEPSRRSGSLSE